MIYKEDSIDIIRQVWESMTFPVKISSVTNDGGGKHTVTTCDMYHAQPGFKLTIGGKDYLIKDIIPGSHPSCGNATPDVLKIKGDAGNITANTFNVYSPFFFHGTPIAQGVELAQENKQEDKTPMGWFYEQFTDSFFEDPTSNKEREIKFRLFCLTKGDPEKWVTEDAYKQAIKPMRRLAETFIEKLKSLPYRFDIDTMEYDILNYAKFGVFINNRGMDKKLWHDNLAGVEINFSNLVIFRKDVCDKCDS